MRTAMVIALVAVLGWSTAPAQTAHLGPELGIYNAQGADNSKLMGGLALRVKLSPALGIEGSVNYRQEDYADGRVTVRSWPVMVTGLLYPLPVVYGAMGAGWYNTTFEYDRSAPGLADYGSETKQQFGWHFGGGLELPLGNRSRLIGDIRYVYLNYDFKTIPGNPNLNSDFYVITLGVLFGL